MLRNLEKALRRTTSTEVAKYIEGAMCICSRTLNFIIVLMLFRFLKSSRSQEVPPFVFEGVLTLRNGEQEIVGPRLSESKKSEIPNGFCRIEVSIFN